MIAAGVPGVIGTLWNVSDNPATVEFFVRFHRLYRDGHPADDALRMAQIAMLRDPDLERRSAIAWAPFQFVGFASSPFQTRANPKRR
jgi:CHAT domain-containing protein